MYARHFNFSQAQDDALSEAKNSDKIIPKESIPIFTADKAGITKLVQHYHAHLILPNGNISNRVITRIEKLFLITESFEIIDILMEHLRFSPVTYQTLIDEHLDKLSQEYITKIFEIAYDAMDLDNLARIFAFTTELQQEEIKQKFNLRYNWIREDPIRFEPKHDFALFNFLDAEQKIEFGKLTLSFCQERTNLISDNRPNGLYKLLANLVKAEIPELSYQLLHQLISYFHDSKTKILETLDSTSANFKKIFVNNYKGEADLEFEMLLVAMKALNANEKFQFVIRMISILHTHPATISEATITCCRDLSRLQRLQIMDRLLENRPQQFNDHVKTLVAVHQMEITQRTLNPYLLPQISEMVLSMGSGLTS